VIFFLPGLILGVGYLVASILRKRASSMKPAAPSHRQAHFARAPEVVVVVTLAFMAANPLARADSATPFASVCEASAPHEAKLLADELYTKGDYQHAAACYDASGDPLRAQRAFLKAVGPNSENVARGLRDENDAAKALVNKMRNAFHSAH
jgi:hypothetical protein